MSFSTVTTNYGFRLIDYATDPYLNDEWFNWQLLDGVISSALTSINFVKATGTGAAFVLTYTPANLSLTIGQRFDFVTNTVNTGACTLNIDGLGAHAIKVNGQDPSANAFASGMYLRVIWDGTNFNVIYPSFSLSQGSHIITATSGATPVTGASDFWVESNASIGMSLLTSASTGIGKYYLGTVTKPDAGGLYYDFSVDRLYLRANQAHAAYMDGNGVLRQPKLPVFYYYSSGSQTPPTAGNAFKPATQSVDQGPSGAAYNSTTGEYVAPLAGIYEFQFFLDPNGGLGNGVNWAMNFMVNGVNSGPTFYFTTTNSGYGTIRGPYRYIVNLSAGDKVKFVMTTVSGDTAAFSYTMVYSGFMLP